MIVMNSRDFWHGVICGLAIGIILLRVLGMP